MSDNKTPARIRGEKNEKGFTLIEIAIVLVIIGLLVGLGAGMLGPLTKRIKVNETKEILDAAVESVISYGASNNELPDSSAFSTTVRKPSDVWNKSLYYILDDNLTDNTIGGICGRKSTNLTINICPDSGCSSPSETINNVAFIVLSGGENFNNQTEGTTSVTTATTINTYDPGVSIDNYTTDMDRTEFYDDIIKWTTVDELRIKSGCVGAPLRIVNNELPYGFQGSAYTATVFGDGGVPYSSGGSYRWCREESSSSGLTFTPSTSSSDCLSLTESSWTRADSLALSGTPSSTGSFNFAFFVRDNNDSSDVNDNIAEKTFVLTVNPASASGCSSYRVWNNTGSAYDFTVDGTCRGTISSNAEVTGAANGYLNNGEQIDRDNNSNGSCQPATASITYVQAVTGDVDGDCCVNFTGSDRTCP